MVATTDDYWKALNETADEVKKRLGCADIAIILGSGLSAFDEILQGKKSVQYDELPWMPLPSVAGHSGTLSLGTLGENKVLCFAGRVHAYENYHGFQLTYQARLAALVGCKILFVTNAAGGWIEGLVPGDAMLIRDHANMHFTCPLSDAAADERFGNARGIDPASIYSSRIALLAQEVAKEIGMRLHSGIYTWNTGPAYETKLEVQSLLDVGIHAFGMSTVPEVMAAHALGLEVCALSVITNLAAGKGGEELHHSEVQDVANKSSAKLRALLVGVLSRVNTHPITLPSSSSSSSLHTIPLKPSPCVISAAHVSHAAKEITRLIAGSDGVDTCVAYGREVWQEVGQKEEGGVELLSPQFNMGAGARATRICLLKTAGGQSVVGVDIPADEPMSDESMLALCAALVQAGIHKIVVFSDARAHDNTSKSMGVAIIDQVLSNTSRVGTWPKASRESVNSPVLRASVEGISGVGQLSRVMHYAGPVFPTPADCMISHKAAKTDAVCVTSITLALLMNALGGHTLVLSVPSSLSSSAAATLSSSLSTAFSVVDKVATTAVTPVTPLSSAVFTGESHQGDVSNENGHFLSCLTQHNIRNPPHEGAPVQYTACVDAADALRSKISANSHTAVWVDGRLPLGPDVFVSSHSINLVEVAGTALPEGSNLVLSFGVWQGDKTVWLVRDESKNPLRSILRPTLTRDVPMVVRVLRTLGVTTILVAVPISSADGLAAGSVYVARDHANWTGITPLAGHNVEEYGTRFPDMSKPYTPLLIEAAETKAKAIQTCVMLIGNCACSPAEKVFARGLGANVIADNGIAQIVTAAHAKMSAGLVGVVFPEEISADSSWMNGSVAAISAMINAAYENSAAVSEPPKTDVSLELE